MTPARVLTFIPSWMAKQATLASSSGSFCTSLSALAARAFAMFPKHTVATSSLLVLTHIRAMFSHTDSLPRKRSVSKIWNLLNRSFPLYFRAFFYSHRQQLCNFRDCSCRKRLHKLRKEFNSHRICQGHQHSRRVIVLGHQHGSALDPIDLNSLDTLLSLHNVVFFIVLYNTLKWNF